MAVTSGSRLGPYEVVDLLGSGGMGEVYRARDPRLNREVAIKVLPEGIADRERLRRFQQEARAAGALNHPNILAIYDVGEHEGAPYIVSELLEGETLRERLGPGRVSIRSAVDYAIQVVRGLAAAHDSGIVHRDLKPDNVFVTQDGRAKILDFGLAKLRRPEGQAHDSGSDADTISLATDPGTVMGTVPYMSPEQVRGEAVDHRSDIFSFGALLYEMLSGRRAFRGSSSAETLGAILKEDPPELSGTGRGISPGLARIVHRCLEKRAGDRFHSAHDLALALEAVSPRISRPSWVGVARGRRLVWTGALVALVAVAGLWILLPREPPPPPLRVRPITSDLGREMMPALSPDGNQVAFVWAREGTQDLYVKLINGGNPLLVSGGEEHSYAPAWSPGGRQIAFIRHVKDGDGQVLAGIFVVPALGGPERRLATARVPFLSVRTSDPVFQHGLSWSPGGKALAFVDRESRDEPDAIFLLSLESGERWRLTRPPAGQLGDFAPRFSPDGRTLAFVRSVVIGDNDIFLVPVDGGGEQRLTELTSHMEGLDWTADGRSIVFSSLGWGGGSVSSLWRVPVSGRASEPLGFGENGHSPTLSRKGARLAYVRQAERDWDIWRVGGPSASEEDRSPARLISSTQPEYQPSYSPDGQQIAFCSYRSGAAEIWICDSDGSNPRQLTFLDDPTVFLPSWSPDGDQIAFSSGKEGSVDVYVVSVSGGVPRRLTTGPAPEFGYSWSRDGRWVYFTSYQAGSREAWKVPAEGGDALQVTTQGGTGAFESHDGRFLYFSKAMPCGAPPGVWRIPRDGGEEVQVLDRGTSASWALVEQGILFADCRSRPPTLELFHFATGEVSRVAVLPNGIPGLKGLSVSPDGRWVLYLGRDELKEDIMLVEGFR